MNPFEENMKHLVAVIGLERAIQSARATPWVYVESVILMLRKKDRCLGRLLQRYARRLGGLAPQCQS